MSFLRMQESPSSATLGDSCIRRNDRNEAFETTSIDDFRKNDRYVNISCFHTVSFAGMTEMRLLRQHQPAKEG
ncbi:MAG: hypothetical protein NT007_16260 [Candidatus Kapabacteria bacterium]|nr:hypothetical protein [Candidatus Kapabacteria bacterium]